MDDSTLTSIEKQVKKLSLQDHIELIQKLMKQLKGKSININNKNNWKELYGLGKGLWDNEDAQEHVNKLREERI